MDNSDKDYFTNGSSVDTITINTEDTIDLSSLESMTFTASPYNYSNVTINSNSTTGFGPSPYIIGQSSGSGLRVSGEAEFDGDVKIKGVSITEMFEKIEKRLAILRPDPEKLEHFEALRKAYEHYKTLEALCEVPKKEDE